MNTRYVIGVVKQKLEQEYRKRCEREAAGVAEAELAKVKDLTDKFQELQAKLVPIRNEQQVIVAQLRVKGIVPTYCWEQKDDISFNYDKCRLNLESNKWQKAKNQELEDLMFKIALSKDKEGVITAFLKGIES